MFMKKHNILCMIFSLLLVVSLSLTTVSAKTIHVTRGYFYFEAHNYYEYANGSGDIPDVYIKGRSLRGNTLTINGRAMVAISEAKFNAQDLYYKEANYVFKLTSATKYFYHNSRISKKKAYSYLKRFSGKGMGITVSNHRVTKMKVIY